MKKRFQNFWLAAAFFLLILLGIIMVYSASAFYAQQYFGDHFYFLKRHLTWLFLGLMGMAAAYSLPYKKLQGNTWILLLISLAILVYTAFIQRGRWVYIGPIHFQAVDVAKFSLILFFADSLSRKEKIMGSYGQGVFPHLFYVAVFSFLTLRQPNFSSAAMIVLIGITMLFAAPTRVWHLALTGLAFIPPLAAAAVISPYKMRRVLSFLNPESDIQGAGYQVYQSLVSLGQGGIAGVGFAQSTQKMFFLPEAHTDFIFAIIGEEWGLIGALTVVALFGIILVHGVRIARRSADRFDVYLAVGVTAHFVYYATINMMVTLRLIPATGLPMPFISYGGTALLFSCIYAGMLLRLAGQVSGRVSANRVPWKERSLRSLRMPKFNYLPREKRVRSKK